jgi:DNA recombination protein RmuC
MPWRQTLKRKNIAERKFMNTMTSIFLFLSGIAAGICLFAFKYISLSKDNVAKAQKIYDLTENIENLSKDNVTKEQKIYNLTENIENQTQLSRNLKIEFENIASKVLEEKNIKLTNSNKNSLESILYPLKEKIDEFKSKIGDLEIYGTAQISGLQNELKNLMSLNKQLSEEANSLAVALKGENKIQGIWGELCVKRIFEYAGMTEGVDYESQKQFKVDDGKKIPDYIVNLPDGKHIIIDAKTSLYAYEKYHNQQNETDKKKYLKEHSTSIKNHIDELAAKDYTGLPGLNNLEYALMFVPLDGAISLALDDKPDLIEYAFKKDIAIVTTSTLLFTLKTIQYIWRQENQKENVLEIAKQGGSLHDNFVTFIKLLDDVDKKISEAKNKTHEAIERLCGSNKKGDSLIKRVQRLRYLGASVKKEIPEDFLKASE